MFFFSQVHSAINYFLWKIRKTIQFKRKGYKEKSFNSLNSKDFYWVQKYHLKTEVLSDYAVQKNIQTLEWLEAIWPHNLTPNIHTVLEAGCQDFIRLPALRAFFELHNQQPTIEGIEIDAFPILDNLHSRWDRAHYYISLEKKPACYKVENFFHKKNQYDLICAFFPLITTHSTLKWGLPLSFANAKLWAQSIEQSLNINGLAIVAHHTEHEQDQFDRERKPFKKLKLAFRKILINSLVSQDQRVYLSLYEKLK